MVEVASGSTPPPVVIYAEGVGPADPGPGAWGAVLRWGEHHREISGADAVTTEGLMRFQAIVRALECLKRPVRADLRTDSPYVASIGEQWLGDADPRDEPEDVLRSPFLAAASAHTVRFSWKDEYAREPDHLRARELAIQAATDAVPDDWPSIDSVLTAFLADKETAASSARAFKKYENVIGTLRWGISWYADKKLNAIPASEITDHLGSFYETLVHKEFASPSQLREVKTVLPSLLKWLSEQGHIDADNARAQIEDAKERLDEYIEIRKFVDKLSDYVDEAAPDISDDDDHSAGVFDEYLAITDVTEDSITFGDDLGEQEVGPVAVPPEVAELAQLGWGILLSAVQIDDEWRLVNVANGESFA